MGVKKTWRKATHKASKLYRSFRKKPIVIPLASAEDFVDISQNRTPIPGFYAAEANSVTEPMVTDAIGNNPSLRPNMEIGPPPTIQSMTTSKVEGIGVPISSTDLKEQRKGIPLLIHGAGIGFTILGLYVLGEQLYRWLTTKRDGKIKKKKQKGRYVKMERNDEVPVEARW